MKLSIDQFDFYSKGKVERIKPTDKVDVKKFNLNNFSFAVVVDTFTDKKATYIILFSKGSPSSEALELSNIIAARMTSNRTIDLGLIPELGTPKLIAQSQDKQTIFWNQIKHILGSEQIFEHFLLKSHSNNESLYELIVYYNEQLIPEV